MFVYLVLNSKNGVVFQYPNINELFGIKIKESLYNSIMGVLDTCCMSEKDIDITEFVFGELLATISRDREHNVHVLLTEKTIDVEKNKALHLTIKALFLKTLTTLGFDLSFVNFPRGDLFVKALNDVFDPFRKVWEQSLK